MDIRHPLKDYDRQMLAYAVQRGLPAHALLTKADKLSRSQQMQTLQKVRKGAALGLWRQRQRVLRRRPHRRGRSPRRDRRLAGAGIRLCGRPAGSRALPRVGADLGRHTLQQRILRRHPRIRLAFAAHVAQAGNGRCAGHPPTAGGGLLQGSGGWRWPPCGPSRPRTPPPGARTAPRGSAAHRPTSSDWPWLSNR